MDVFVVVLFGLLFGHALADYPLQGDFLAKAKNAEAPIPGIPWWIAMAAHTMIHAGMVTLFTGSYLLGAVEFFLHYVIDDQKCRGYLSFASDQFLHVLCKVLFAAIVGVAGGVLP